MARRVKRRRLENHEVLLLKVQADIIDPGTAGDVDVRHDDRCGRGSRCNCIPEITITTPAGRLEILKPEAGGAGRQLERAAVGSS